MGNHTSKTTTAGFLPGSHAPAIAARAIPATSKLTFTVPTGVKPGKTFTVETPGGTETVTMYAARRSGLRALRAQAPRAPCAQANEPRLRPRQGADPNRLKATIADLV